MNAASRPSRCWIASIDCPLCAARHLVVWPHMGFPTASQHYSFTCPEAGHLVVLSQSLNWGAIHAMEEAGPALEVSPFHG